MPEKTVTIDLRHVGHQVLVLVGIETALAVVLLVGLAWWALHRRSRDAVDVPPIAGPALERLRRRLEYALATVLLSARAAVTRLAHGIVWAGDRGGAHRAETR